MPRQIQETSIIVLFEQAKNVFIVVIKEVYLSFVQMEDIYFLDFPPKKYV